MYSRKRKHSVVQKLERESIKEDSSKEENEKLKDKISVMKHHLCLLEFGLGSIATLLLEGIDKATKGKNQIPSTSSSTSSSASTVTSGLLEAKERDNVEEEESVGNSPFGCDKERCEKYRETVMAIGGVLADVETALKSAKDDDKDVTPVSASGNRNISSASTSLSQACKGGADDEIQNLRKKDKIHIDENVLTGLCNIKVVENESLYDYNHHPSNMKPGQGSGPTAMGLEALSTLASVASSVAIQEGIIKGLTPNIGNENGAMNHLENPHNQRGKRVPRQWKK